MPDKFDKAWKGPEQRHSEGDIDYLFRRMAWLEEKVRDMEELIHFVGDGLEEHSGSYAHGGRMMGNPIASMRFFMVPWAEETETVLRSIIDYQREAFRGCLKGWLNELPSNLDSVALEEFIERTVLHYQNHLDEYADFCVSTTVLEKRLQMRNEERRPLTDHLLYVGKIEAFSFNRKKKGPRITKGIEEGLKHVFGVPLAPYELNNIIRSLLIRKADGSPISYSTMDNGMLVYNLNEHRN